MVVLIGYIKRNFFFEKILFSKTSIFTFFYQTVNYTFMANHRCTTSNKIDRFHLYSTYDLISRSASPPRVGNHPYTVTIHQTQKPSSVTAKIGANEPVLCARGDSASPARGPHRRARSPATRPPPAPHPSTQQTTTTKRQNRDHEQTDMPRIRTTTAKRGRGWGAAAGAARAPRQSVLARRRDRAP